MLLRNVLTREECLQLVEEFDASSARQQEGDAFYRGSIGLYQPPGSLSLVERLQQQLEPVFGTLEFENSYLRAYVKGSILGIHTDRPGLDITLSVCLEHDFDTLPSHEPWKGDALALELGLGDGAAMDGIRYPHWREEFSQEGRAVYIFFHWRRRRPPVTEPPKPRG
jgi:hypothetical protein